VSGIVMNPFYPAYTRYSPFARFYKEILYWAVSRRKNIEKLFILNDQENVDWLNRHFCSNKFRYIPDPVPFFKPELLPADIYEIKRSRRIALHFGVLSERKGTLLILDAIDILPEDTIDKVSFLFAGKPCDNDFGEKIERKITALQQKRRNISIIYKPDFATSGMMESYFYLSDFVLIPYTMRNMSSGVLGHAAKYGKPVITGKGLLESIVNKYRLGIAVEPTIENIKNAIIRFADQNEDRVISDYAKEHSVSSFVETMMN
jgi:glycosyltransferase involved in cell wall biosynthesis